GLRESDWKKIAGARLIAPFKSLDDFVRRSGLDEGVLGKLAEAGAYESFGVDRRTALWDIGRLVRARNESLSLPAREVTPAFESLTGFVNVVVWESVFNRYSLLAKTVNFLGITGTLQVEDGIVHLVAEELWEPRLELKPASTPSRDFH